MLCGVLAPGCITFLWQAHPLLCNFTGFVVLVAFVARAECCTSMRTLICSLCSNDTCSTACDNTPDRTRPVPTATVFDPTAAVHVDPSLLSEAVEDTTTAPDAHMDVIKALVAEEESNETASCYGSAF
ncbi:hypothetical protein BDB00DRAFT_788350 [Zychaea mexicana]|uniref:uncharacterized protein n=1 Tax=Zychaea mexicana TaxID=64656 RepID=UPI0022FE7399|nr:uncharacterized protein BDB00DRAFT_788350 [Zychaea mexicana]KAI9492860.1 hypothetical protein BDB00DRAFT_788350 [Zychaea mexicana]